MSPPLNLTLHFEMTSDWHIGTGAGRHGGIDRLVARDADGIPYIPASTWRGMWRDAAEILARGLDGAESGGWQDLVRKLFGSQPAHTDKQMSKHPVASSIFPRDARFVPALLPHLVGCDGRQLRDALTFVKPGVAIDSATGTARSNFLRFEEMAVAGALLRATAKVDLETSDKETLLAFLAGAAALIERIGGKRRRGSGRCNVTLECDGKLWPSSAAAARLREANGVPVVSAQADEQYVGGTYSTGGTWFEIPIAIRLDAPLVMTDEVLGNVITTLDHIPGTALVPIVAEAAARGGLANVHDRLSRGDLRVLPATIDIGGRRALPVPLCWSQKKDAPKSGPIEVVSSIIDSLDRSTQYKALRKGYLSVIEAGATTAHARVVGLKTSLPTSVRTHNVVADETQTPTADVGGVFSYEALAAGQTFRSVVRIRGVKQDHNQLQAALEAAFKSPILLGRGKQAGYGVVMLEIASVERDKNDRREWCNSDKSKLVVWLESDALLPGDDLAGTNEIEALARAVETAIGKSGIFKLAQCRAWLRTRRIQSWQTKWHLPRPSLMTVQAGSVAMLELEDGVALSDGELGRAEETGIGERRAEGFGAIRLNDATVTRKVQLLKVSEVVTAPSPTTPEAPLQSMTEAETDMLSAVIDRAWRRRIMARAETVMSDSVARKEAMGWDAEKGWPSMSQLGGLRAVLPQLPASCNVDSNPVKDWIDGQDRKRGKRDENTAQSPWQKVTMLVTAPGEIWTTLGIAANTDGQLASSGTHHAMRTKLWSFAVKNTLLLAIRHHKRATEKPSEQAIIVAGDVV